VTRELWRDLRPGAYGHGSQGKGGGWPGLRQILCVVTTREALDPAFPSLVSERTFLTSLPPQNKGKQGSPEALLDLIRSHWGIENKLHHVKDRSLREDEERSGPAAITLSRLRSLAVGLLARLPGRLAPDKFQAVLANDSLASDLIAKPLPQL
jgi:hypothetical protein